MLTEPNTLYFSNRTAESMNLRSFQISRRWLTVVWACSFCLASNVSVAQEGQAAPADLEETEKTETEKKETEKKETEEKATEDKATEEKATAEEAEAKPTEDSVAA